MTQTRPSPELPLMLDTSGGRTLQLAVAALGGWTRAGTDRARALLRSRRPLVRVQWRQLPELAEKAAVSESVVSELDSTEIYAQSRRSSGHRCEETRLRFRVQRRAIALG